ncbi:MAG: YggT family protein [Calditrichaeota bacterium]|nr:YggT family protein [Calditrichota bacterium]
MFIFQHLFSALGSVLHLLFTLYIYVIIARVVISWIRINPYNQIVRFIVRITEPPLAWIRKYIPTFGGLDFSPVILIFVVVFLDRFLVSTLWSIAAF